MALTSKNIAVIGIAITFVVGSAEVTSTWLTSGQLQTSSASATSGEMVGTAAAHGVAINAKGKSKVSVVVDSPAQTNANPPLAASTPKSGMHADATGNGTVINTDNNAEVKVTRTQQRP